MFGTQFEFYFYGFIFSRLANVEDYSAKIKK